MAIARAFATEPDLLLMDEPFGQLDTNTRFQIETRLIEVWEKTKRTVIFVTHNLEEAVYLAERILVLTNKPTTIKEVVKVDLPRPRNFADPEFVSHPQAGYGPRQVVVAALIQRKGHKQEIRI